MKAPILCISAVLVASSLFASKASAIIFPVRSDSGTQCYSLEAPASYTPDVKYLTDPWMQYTTAHLVLPISAGAAEVAAVGWAGGLKEHDMPSGVSPYPNNLTNLGSKYVAGRSGFLEGLLEGLSPGGFYNASFVHPTHVERVEGPSPHYLVTMTGVTGGEHQTLYAVVLDDGRLVEPTVVPCVERHERPVMRHHRRWGGAKWGGQEKKPPQ
jgi:hypothetical protein